MYIVYHKESKKILLWKYSSPQKFANAGAAKAGLSRAVKKDAIKHAKMLERGAWRSIVGRVPEDVKDPINKDDYVVMDVVKFMNEVDVKVEVKNLMSGKVVMESINLPYYMSVSSESYWSS